MTSRLPVIILMFIAAFIVCVSILFMTKKIINELDIKIQEIHDCEKRIEGLKKDVSNMMHSFTCYKNEQICDIKEIEKK